MFLPFLYTLRSYKVPVSTQEWLALMEVLSRNEHDSSLDRFYTLSRAVLVKSESLYDAFDQAFVACFKNLEGNFDFKKEIWDWLNRSVAERPALPEGIQALDLEELRKKFLERMQEQKEAHHGGSHWIGTGGTSPFGHSGSHPSGIRIGGPGGGRSAMQVAEERRFQNYRQDRILDTRQFKVALKRLRKLDRTGAAVELNLQKSIKKTCENAGDIEIVLEAPKKNQAELLLLMDVGGSMDPYAELMESLFSAAHASTHFKAFQHYYFHNCIYGRIYLDAQMREWIPTEEAFRRFRSSFYTVIVGDALMNPYELLAPGGAINYWENNRETGMTWLQRIREHYHHSVWLNPEPQAYWQHPTVEAIRQVFKMFPLTVEGLTQAVDQLRKK